MITDRETASPAGRGEGRGVSAGALLRRTGLVAVAAGVSVLLIPFLHPDDPGNAAWVPVHLLYFAALIAVLLVLVGVFVASYRGPGAWAWPVSSSRSSARP